MSQPKHIGIKAFIVTFLFSMAVLGLISSGIAALTGLFTPVDSSQQSVAGEPEYQPVSEDNLTLLLMCGEDDVKPPDRFTLLRFCPEERVIRFVPLPPELEATVNIKTGTLSQLYEYGGVDMVCAGVQNAFFIQVDRYIKCNERALADLIDQVGGIEYRVEQTVEYKDETGESVRLVEGLQLLGGNKVIDYWHSPLMAGLSGEARLKKQAAFLEAGLEQRFSEGILSRIDDLFDQLSNSMQTNLTNYDYTVRKEAIRFLARIKEEKVTCQQLDGSYREEKKTKIFTPSSEGKAMVQGWFEALEE